MLRTTLVSVGIMLAGFASPAELHSTQLAPQSTNHLPQSGLANSKLLATYCIACYNQNAPAAGLTLDRSSMEKVGGDEPVWQKIVHKLRRGAIQRPGRPRPD